jgi:hypothetical protein
MAFLFPFIRLSAQLSGNNLFEFQLGNLPYTSPADLSSHYNQLNLNYRSGALRATIRYEQFLSQTDESSYYRLSQFEAEYQKGKLELKAGNFNETLGNGILYRGYEITGSVFEEEFYRTRYGFYRDLLGISGKYSGDIWYFQAIRGKSLINALPPTLSAENRRIDLVEAVETGITVFSQTLGLIILRNSNSFGKDLFSSILFSGSAGGFSYNFEYAHNLAGDAPAFSRDEVSKYGLYGSISYSRGSLGLSFEFKDYHDLLIGAGINDPPTTVREHKYKVLNRSIHVPQLLDESGLQAEGYLTFGNGSRLVANYTYSVNQFVRRFRFNEVFFEYTFYPGNRSDVALFADYARDELKSENIRLAAGTVWDYSLAGSWSTQLHLEYQYIERTILEPVSIHNGVISAGFSRSPAVSVSIIWEVSNDPYLVDRPDTQGTETTFRHWPGLETSYRVNTQNTLGIFLGKRRGGPACTSGICYEVLDFEGLEIRWTIKF